MRRLLLNQTEPLRHVAGSPDLGLLRALRPLPPASVGDGPSHPARAGCPGPTGTTGRVPTFTVDRSTGPASSYAPAPSPWLRRRPSPWPPGPTTFSDPGVPRPTCRPPGRSRVSSGRDGYAVRPSPCPPGSGLVGALEGR